jgi:hypothetical protein
MGLASSGIPQDPNKMDVKAESTSLHIYLVHAKIGIDRSPRLHVSVMHLGFAFAGVAILFLALVIVAFTATLVTVSIEIMLTAALVAFLEPIAFFAASITVAICHLTGVLRAAAWTEFVDVTLLSALVTLTITAVLFSAFLALDE